LHYYVFPIDTGLIIVFQGSSKNYDRTIHKHNILLKAYISTISQMLTTLKLFNILTSEEDKQLHKKIPHYFLTKNVVAYTTDMFILGVPVVSISLLGTIHIRQHFDHVQHY